MENLQSKHEQLASTPWSAILMQVERRDFSTATAIAKPLLGDATASGLTPYSISRSSWQEARNDVSCCRGQNADQR